MRSISPSNLKLILFSKIHISQLTSIRFLEGYDFCPICVLITLFSQREECWKPTSWRWVICGRNEIDKYSSKPLTNTRARHWQIFDGGNWSWKNLYCRLLRRLRRLVSQPVKCDINAMDWNLMWIILTHWSTSVYAQLLPIIRFHACNVPSCECDWG